MAAMCMRPVPKGGVWGEYLGIADPHGLVGGGGGLQRVFTIKRNQKQEKDK